MISNIFTAALVLVSAGMLGVGAVLAACSARQMERLGDMLKQA